MNSDTQQVWNIDEDFGEKEKALTEKYEAGEMNENIMTQGTEGLEIEQEQLEMMEEYYIPDEK